MHLIFLLFALFASLFSIEKFALKVAPPCLLVGTRMTLAGLFILTFLSIKDKKMPSIAPSALFLCSLLGFFGIYLTNVLEFWGLQFLTASKTCLIYSISPFVSALLSYLYFAEKMTPRKWLGFSIGIFGMTPIFLSDGNAALLKTSLAELAVVTAAISSTYGWVLLRRLVTQEKLSFLLANGYSMLIGGLFALTQSYFVDNWNADTITNWPQFVIGIAAMMIVSNLICYNLYGYLLQRFTATLISFSGFTTPLFAALFAYLFLGETVTTNFWITCAFVLTGLWVFYGEELRQGYVKA